MGVRGTVLVAVAIAACWSRLAVAAHGTTTLVSRSSTGQLGDGTSGLPDISADGRYVAFDSKSSNLVPGDTNGRHDVFVRDLVAGTTTRASVSTGGLEGNGGSAIPSISGDGRMVAFASLASNLVSGDTNGLGDVFVRDLVAGTTTLVSANASGEMANAASYEPAVSADGRYVTFMSEAANLVPGDTNNNFDVFVRDLSAGTVARASIAFDGAEAAGGSAFADISADGRFVAFESDATNLVPDDANRWSDVFVRDMVASTTIRVSVASDGTDANDLSNRPSIADDGRAVAFESWASNLAEGDTNSRLDIYVRDLASGRTSRVSVSSDGSQAAGESRNAAISGNGRYVVFYSDASNLVRGDTNYDGDVFIHDRVTSTTRRVSVSTGGQQGLFGGGNPVVSTSGLVAFESFSPNLVADDTNLAVDVFVHDQTPSPACPRSGYEEGPVSGPLHDAEVLLGPASPLAHWINCELVVPAESGRTLMTGTISLRDCFIRNTAFNCTDNGFKLSSIPATYNPTYSDVCNAVNTYVDGTTRAVICSIQNGGNAPGTVPASVVGPGCGVLTANWTISWSNASAGVFYRDTAGEVYRLTNGNIKGLNYQQANGVDQWELQVSLTGYTAPDFFGRRNRATFTLAGSAVSTSNCQGGIAATRLNFRLAGDAIVEQV